MYKQSASKLTVKDAYVIAINRQLESARLLRFILPYLKSNKISVAKELIAYSNQHSHDQLGRKLNLRKEKNNAYMGYSM